MILLALFLQTTPVAPIVKGTALPPPAGEEAAVLAPIDAILAAIPRRDAAAITAQLYPGGTATLATEGADGARRVRRMTFAEWTAAIRPGTERLAETQGTPAVEIDGDVAMVWAPYTFTIDGKAHHCGYNHFDLVRDAGAWKVANVTWSQRIAGCAAR